MKRFLKKRKMRGFTLVELLIVIIIIGILAGALLLVAGAGTDKANATKIVSNLRGMKAAAMMSYSDYNDWTTMTIASIGAYMENTPTTDYVISGDCEAIGYSGSMVSTANGNVNEKLALMVTQGEIALYDSTGGSFDAGDTAVYMIVR